LSIPTVLCDTCKVNQAIKGFNAEKAECFECWAKRTGASVDPIIERKIVPIRSLSAKCEGRTNTFDALVSSTGEFKTVTTQVDGLCPQCHNTISVIGNGFENPKMPYCNDCNVKIRELPETAVTMDMMRIVIEEFLEESENNSPVFYDGIVFGNDIKTTFAGQRKRITAVYKSVKAKDGKTNDVVLLVDEIEDIGEPDYIKLTPEEAQVIKERISKEGLGPVVNSFASDIEGDLDNIKKSFLVTIVGGSEGATRRTNSHVMLIGNPSGGKSELGKRAIKCVSKASYVIGVSTTKAGLGSGMVKMPNGTSVVRAGPLILNSGGLVVIDEFDKMHPEDKKGLLECQEQQTVTITKAGVESQRTAKTAIISIANPKYGIWSYEDGILENINVDSFSLQRNDLIWKLPEHNDITNSNMADVILKLGVTEKLKLFQTELELKKYVNYVKTLNPQIRDSAKRMIKHFYLKMSKTKHKDTLPMEPRQLEGLIRISTAIAKMKMKDEADEIDVQEAIDLYKASLESFGIDTHGDIQQMKLVEEKMTREQLINHIVKESSDENGHFKHTDVIRKWVEKDLFKDTESAEKFFDKHVGEKFFRCEDGKYRKSQI